VRDPALNDSGAALVAVNCTGGAGILLLANPLGTATANVIVTNVAPALDPLVLSAPVIQENGSVEVQGSFADPGTLDTHTVTVEWGDSPRRWPSHLTTARGWSRRWMVRWPWPG
jgi:hypothetical protein